jgi:ribosomal protein S18 acetylase RimI-like enzyme
VQGIGADCRRANRIIASPDNGESLHPDASARMLRYERGGEYLTTIRVVAADSWQEWRGLRLRALNDAPEAFGSSFADWQSAGESRWRNRLDEVAYNVIADLDHVPAGMASGSNTDRGVELMSLWIAPFARGKGIGNALVNSVVGWAVSAGCGEVSLNVREANAPAIALYRRHGFVDAGLNYEDANPIEPPEHKMVLVILR